MTEPDACNPYAGLPQDAFWRSAVAGRDMQTLGAFHRPKFTIDRSTKVAMAGSCFAHRIGRQLRARGFTIIDEEPGPPGLTPEEEARYGFGLYSARYGNIYTARQLRQLVQEAFEEFTPGDPIWRRGDQVFDALRPTVEPDGLKTAQAVRQQRRYHLRRVREVISSAEVFVFTLGLSETWIHAATGTVYPTAPGVVCGAFDPAKHQFKNLSAAETHADLSAFFSLARRHNPGLKLVLTVSPQRPTATATGQHVLVAAAYSKAVLRAAAGQLASERDDVDYFPSYELVTNPLAGNRYFNANLRTVTEEGAAVAVDAFLGSYAAGVADQPAEPPPADPGDAEEDVVCEEELLQAFAP